MNPASGYRRIRNRARTGAGRADRTVSPFGPRATVPVPESPR